MRSSMYAAEIGSVERGSRPRRRPETGHCAHPAGGGTLRRLDASLVQIESANLQGRKARGEVQREQSEPAANIEHVS